MCAQGNALPQRGQVMGRFGDFRQEREACWLAKFCFYKTCRGNLPRLAFYGMRSQYKFVITAGLLCHLFVTVPLVTSQALTKQSVQNPALSAEQNTPIAHADACRAEQEITPTKAPIGNCHSVITSAPAVPQAGMGNCSSSNAGKRSGPACREQERCACPSAKSSR